MKKSEARYIVTFHTEEQLVLLQKIAECYLRERMGQFWDLAEDTAGEGCGYVYDKSDPYNSEKFDAFIQRRDKAQTLFESAFSEAKANRHRTESMNQAEDFYDVIRHAIWLEKPESKPHHMNDAQPGLHWNKEQPLPVCYKDQESMAWKMNISGAQLGFIQDMSEYFMRERMGQFVLLTESLAYDCAGFHYEKKEPDYEKRLQECTDNAMRAKELFELGYRASGAADHLMKTRRMKMAYDFFSVVRHYFWLQNPNPKNYLAAGEPLHECKEVPLIEISKA